jgi:iron complex outermembrane recepter protein
MTKFNRYFYLLTFCFCTLAIAGEENEALDLSVEDLLNVKVTSVAKKAQSLNDAAAAAFVISNEDIKRSGATNIPDALRLAPGLDVARIDANKWAVTSRGFNGRRANKLLVLVDGRSAYTRSFAGVYWENQDVMMEDVDRIEVIRGPGATLWGANAVNGVINIITKHSAKTQGLSFHAGGGTQEQDFAALRYGMKFGENTTARAYVKGFHRADNTHLTGENAGDNWDKVQGGFRLDSQLDTRNALTLQGDMYHSNFNQSSIYQQTVSPYFLFQNDTTRAYGGNILGRWQHTLSSTSDYTFQVYFDTFTRNEASLFEKRDTFDVDFQHRFTLLDSNEIVWGLSYRYGNDKLLGKPIQNGTIPFNINLGSVHDQVFSGFIQDEISLIDNKLWLTLGSKFEHNDYSGFEGQPSARIMWAPHAQHRLWAGVSRAVRTPARYEQSLTALTRVYPPYKLDPNNPFPTALVTHGNPNFRSEEVISYEAGYRTSFSKAISLDITGFYNDYRDVRKTIPGSQSFDGQVVTQNVMFTNGLDVHSYGIEIATVWQMLDWWRWDVNYSWLHTQLNAAVQQELPVSPQQHVSLRGSISPWNNTDFDFWFRYVDTNTAQNQFGAYNIKPYVTLDLRLAYRPVKNIELSLVGQNLLAEKHLEFVNEIQTLPTEIDRGMYGKISWGF